MGTLSSGVVLPTGPGAECIPFPELQEDDEDEEPGDEEDDGDAARNDEEGDLEDEPEANGEGEAAGDEEYDGGDDEEQDDDDDDDEDNDNDDGNDGGEEEEEEEDEEDEDEDEGDEEQTPAKKRKEQPNPFLTMKPSLHSTCCFPDSSSSSSSSDIDKSRLIRSTSTWIRSSSKPEIKDRCFHLFAFIGRGCSNRRNQASTAEFRYDPLSYALNFDDESRVDELPLRNFASTRTPTTPARAAASSGTEEEKKASVDQRREIAAWS
ncbi:hypothetical protein AKJ16_DCAP04891 [Drosera capensis]